VASEADILFVKIPWERSLRCLGTSDL